MRDEGLGFKDVRQTKVEANPPKGQTASPQLRAFRVSVKGLGFGV